MRSRGRGTYPSRGRLSTGSVERGNFDGDIDLAITILWVSDAPRNGSSDGVVVLNFMACSERQLYKGSLNAKT